MVLLPPSTALCTQHCSEQPSLCHRARLHGERPPETPALTLLFIFMPCWLVRKSLLFVIE